MTREDLEVLRKALWDQHGKAQIAFLPLKLGFNERDVRAAADAAVALAAQASDIAQALVLWRQEQVVRPGESARLREFLLASLSESIHLDVEAAILTEVVGPWSPEAEAIVRSVCADDLAKEAPPEKTNGR